MAACEMFGQYTASLATISEAKWKWISCSGWIPTLTAGHDFIAPSIKIIYPGWVMLPNLLITMKSFLYGLYFIFLWISHSGFLRYPPFAPHISVIYNRHIDIWVHKPRWWFPVLWIIPLLDNLFLFAGYLQGNPCGIWIFSPEDIFIRRDLILMKVAVNLRAHFVQFGLLTVATCNSNKSHNVQERRYIDRRPVKMLLLAEQAFLSAWNASAPGEVHSELQPWLLEIMPLCHFISHFLYFFLYPFSNIAHCI